VPHRRARRGATAEVRRLHSAASVRLKDRADAEMLRRQFGPDQD
jgi:hypothetical protein